MNFLILGLQLVNLVNRHGLSQIINEPTRITDQTASLLDLIITDWSGLNTAQTMAPFDVAFQLYNDIDDIVHCWVNLVKQTLKNLFLVTLSE